MKKHTKIAAALLVIIAMIAALAGIFLQKSLLSAQLSGFPDSPIYTLEGKAAAALRDEGIIVGFPDGELKGYEPINRAQVAKMLLLLKKDPMEDDGTRTFTDVIPGAWYESFVNTASRLGIVDGYSDQTFRPENTINTVEFLKMLSKAFNAQTGIPHEYKDVSPTAWYNQYAGIAFQYNLLPSRRQGFLSPEARLTRGEVIIALYIYDQAVLPDENTGSSEELFFDEFDFEEEDHSAAEGEPDEAEFEWESGEQNDESFLEFDEQNSEDDWMFE